MNVKKWLLGLMTFAAMAVICAVCAGAENAHTAYIKYADNNWYPSVLDGSGYTDSGIGMVTTWKAGNCNISESGTYTVSVSDIKISTIDEETGDECMESVNGEGAVVLVVDIQDISAVLGLGKGSEGFDRIATSKGRMDFAKSKGADVTDIKITQVKDGKATDIPVDMSKIYFGDIEGNGNFRIEIYSDYGDTLYDPPIDTEKIDFNESLSVQFTIVLPKEIQKPTYEYAILPDETIEIIGYNGSESKVVIPDKIDGKKVTGIGDYAFESCTNLTSITIPDSVTNIGEYAFQSCSNLTSITIPDSVTNIGQRAFLFCKSIKNITIPKSVQDIGEYAFHSCTSLEKINVAAGNENYVSVNGILFSKDKTKIVCYPANKNGTSYSIPNSVKVIGSAAFRDCSHLKNITIPDSVSTIEHHAFSCCTSLTKVTIPDGVTIIEMGVFDNCRSLTSVRIPDSVTEIGHSAFNACISLKNITVPRSVTKIGFFGLGAVGTENKVADLTIYCYSGTKAEYYAKGEKFNYVLLDKLPTLAKVSGVKLGGRAADALRVNWTKNANADGYIVEMYQNGKWVRVVKITNNSTTTFRKAGLKAGTVYKFRVKAYKMYDITAAYSAYSATVTARTNPSVIKGAKLGGRAADALRINWTKNTSADGYIVEMYQGNKWVRVAKITNNSTTTFRKAGLKASTVYKFRVRAYKMSGKTALYGNYSATVTARANPSVMKGVKIGGKAKDALRVNWTKNTSAQGYIVEMYKGGKWVRVAKITNGNTTTFRKAGLAKNTAYKFRVRAYHMSGKAALYGNYGSVSGKTTAK